MLERLGEWCGEVIGSSRLKALCFVAFGAFWGCASCRALVDGGSSILFLCLHSMREIVRIVRWYSCCLMKKYSENQRAHLHPLMHLAELAILRLHLGNSQLPTIVSKGQTRRNPESRPPNSRESRWCSLTREQSPVPAYLQTVFG
jgi:hypothetical protein